MIILSNTTDSLQAVLGGNVTTNQLTCVCSFRDTTSTTFLPERKNTLTNNTTAVDIVSSPAASTQRVIDYVSIYNTDTASATVTIRYNESGTFFPIFKVTIAAGEKLEYSNDKGWVVFTSLGAVKQSLNAGASPIGDGWNLTILPTNQTNNNAVANTIQDVTGLSFPITAGGTYAFIFTVQYTAALTTTGSRWSVNFGGGGTGTLRYGSYYSLTTASQTVNTGLSAVDLPATSNATSASTAQNTATVSGTVVASANGTLQLRFASEVSSSAIVALAGVSYVEFIQLS